MVSLAQKMSAMSLTNASGRWDGHHRTRGRSVFDNCVLWRLTNGSCHRPSNISQRFLDFKEVLVFWLRLKARSWGTLSERLPFFVDWIKPGTHVSTINGNTLSGFYEWLLRQPWGHERRKNVFNTCRQWIRWACRQDDVELEHLPKTIDSREFVFLTHLDDTGVAKKTRTDRLWTRDEFKLTLQHVSDDMQLFLLLMLNCGFTNTDVASLVKSEVNLKQGRIIRQRTKTRRHTHPPIVNYKLWPKTLSLLTEHWSEHPTLVLTNRRGNPLAVSKLVKEGGKTKEILWTGIRPGSARRSGRYQVMNRSPSSPTSN